MPHSDRRRRLATAIPDDVDAILVTARPDVRWASGFSGSVAAVLVPRDAAIAANLAVDGRYVARARSEAAELDLVETREYAVELCRLAGSQGLRRIGVDAASTTLSAWDEWTAAAGSADVTLVAGPAVVPGLRAVKDADEVDALRQACAITDAAFDRVLPLLRPGLTETEIDGMLLAALRDCGAEAPAFDAIVAAGPNGATPHHSPTDREVEAGELLTLDFGARYAGMHADMTRTVTVGAVADWQHELYELVHEVQRVGREAIRPGESPAELDRRCTALLTAAGHRRLHGLGHGVGLEIHEEPWLVDGMSSAPLAVNSTVTVEPGAYPTARPGRSAAGVRIEDTLVVTVAGSELLTRSARELLTIG